MKVTHYEGYETWEDITLSVANQERKIQKRKKLEKLNKMSLEDKEKY